MAPHSRPRPQLRRILLLLISLVAASAVDGATWCVARSDASQQALQRALDYACGSGADCAPVQSEGLCFLPNTLQAHASYAFNSYYQIKSMEPGSCDFAGTATVAASDPSNVFLPPHPDHTLRLLCVPIVSKHSRRDLVRRCWKSIDSNNCRPHYTDRSHSNSNSNELWRRYWRSAILRFGQTEPILVSSNLCGHHGPLSVRSPLD
ncbi:hypothetical protein SAY86_018845 [Trapa natans]|uniref:X8 domain-containing protein n=1 Tax=Trapa natans TaxID=22666 RepID=A0AAN7LRR1_TRANT|nr:hypothetical protein SAY86_018845 [Trapa natans]